MLTQSKYLRKTRKEAYTIMWICVCDGNISIAAIAPSPIEFDDMMARTIRT